MSPDEIDDCDGPGEREGPGDDEAKGIGGSEGPEVRYEQGRLAVAQLLQTGRASSHFACRCLHSLQPYLDLRCGRRIVS